MSQIIIYSCKYVWNYYNPKNTAYWFIYLISNKMATNDFLLNAQVLEMIPVERNYVFSMVKVLANQWNLTLSKDPRHLTHFLLH